MEKLIYKKKGKAVLVLLQAVAAAVLVYCLLNIGFWMEDSYSLKEMSKNYEETDLFFRQVDTILQHKIRGQENQELFEEDGEFSGTKEIDIQSYESGSNSVKDLNTTYRLEDLLSFYESGGWQKLHDALQDSLQGNSRQEAGEALDGQSTELETVKPVTGISLAECSRWYSDPASFVLNMYTRLDEVCGDVYTRYQEYTTIQDESWSSEAPSNLRYCIEDTSTGTLYTNLAVESYGDASSALLEEPEFTMLYEGERSFNIMVTNPDNVMNADAGEWFMEERFVSTNEKVFLAVDTAYPVNDGLKTYADFFSQREGIVWGSALVGCISLLVLLGAAILFLMGTGWEAGRCTLRLYRIDRVPTELAGSLYMIVAVLCLLVLSSWRTPVDEIVGRERLLLSLVSAGAWLVFVSAVASFVRRFRGRTLWKNSITRMLLYTWRQVTAARTAAGQLLVFYLIFFVLNFLFLLVFGRVGIVLVLVMDLAVLLYLLRDMAGKRTVFEGIHQISKGDLDYRIDATTLQGEAYEMARAVNEMGDGLQKAVDAIVKNERLKAELITNVSHDIKTPLTSIVNYVDLLKREHLEGERVQQYIQVLDQKSQRLRQLTEDLVEASKISSGNVELHMMKIQLQSMLDQAYGEFEERLEEKHLTVVRKLEKEPVCIMADGRQFWRILENLMGNICKYAMENTRVFLTMKKDGDRAVITLENTCREKLTVEADELTGRFVRGDKSRNTEGSGLGLSIAQNLTELQNGSFRISLEGDSFLAELSFPLAEV